MATLHYPLTLQYFLSLSGGSFRVYQDGKPGDTSFNLVELLRNDTVMAHLGSPVQITFDTDDRNMATATYVDVNSESGWQHLLLLAD
jgi:hypothetical protein